MLKSKLGVFVAVVLAACGTQLRAQVTQNPPRKAAIFVADRTGKKELAGKDAVLEDLLTSRIGGQGFTVISRQIALDAIEARPKAGSVAQ